MGNVSLELPILERSAVRVFSAMIGSVLSKAYTVFVSFNWQERNTHGLSKLIVANPLASGHIDCCMLA